MRCAEISRREKKKNKKKQRRTKRLSQRQGGAKITLTTPRHPKSSLPHTFYHTDTALTSPHADLKVIHSPTLHASQRAVFRLRLPGPDTAQTCRREITYLNISNPHSCEQIKTMRWVGHVACMENTYRNMEKHEETNSKTQTSMEGMYLKTDLK